jgi:hypothetical protein
VVDGQRRYDFDQQTVACADGAIVNVMTVDGAWENNWWSAEKLIKPCIKTKPTTTRKAVHFASDHY